jgi:hypothetical protein
VTNRLLLSGALLSVLFGQSADAGLVSGTSSTFGIHLPADPLTDPSLSGRALAGGSINVSTIFAFNERQSLRLATNLVLDTGGMIAANTWISSHYLLFDPSTNNLEPSGRLVFDYPILGVIRTSASLAATDALLGVVGATYGTRDGSGLEGNDIVTWTGNQLTFSFRTNQVGDHLRIITAAPAVNVVQEPHSNAVWAGCAAIGMLFWRIGRRQMRA